MQILQFLPSPTSQILRSLPARLGQNAARQQVNTSNPGTAHSSSHNSRRGRTCPSGSDKRSGTMEVPGSFAHESP